MNSKIADELENIEYLLARHKILHNRSIGEEEDYDILCRLEESYSNLADSYSEIYDNISKCSTLVKHAEILIKRYLIKKSKIYDKLILNEIEQLNWVLENCTDIDIRRSAFVLISRCYFFTKQYTLAENYIQYAYGDYDFSVSTFQLYMEILDSQAKYAKILVMLSSYLDMSIGYHRACIINDFNLVNIMQSSYANKFIKLFDNH